MTAKRTTLSLLLALSALPALAPAQAVLWQNPEDIGSRNLVYGAGGKEHAPLGPVVFLKEDLEGTNPKFDVRDQAGTKWKLKLGLEARPETAAYRIAWAVGYFTDEAYFIQDLQIQGLPAHLHRGRNLVDANGFVHNARLKRHPKDQEKEGGWKWRHDPFTGTRELNGLRVLMAVMDNWDLKDENNKIYKDGSKEIYTVSDLGASFGWTGLRFPLSKCKGNLDNYTHSGFIRKSTQAVVDFATPSRPTLIFLLGHPIDYFKRVHLEWIGRNIPRDDARWMGKLLASLSPTQIQDAFRAAGYSPEEVNAFAAVVARRITMLTDL